MSQMGGLLLLCAFGIVSSLTLYYNEGLRESKWINAIYSAGFVLFNVLYWLGVYSSMGGLEGNGAAGFKVVGFVLLAALGWAVGWACNVAAVYWVMQYYLSVFVRDVSGLDQIVVRKTFDRAEAAEARADYEKAAALYAEEIAAEPLDREAHRRLGELLLKMARPEQAAEELRKVLELSEGEEHRCEAAFRLAEVLQEEFEDLKAAADLYRTVIQDYPEGKHAAYARMRMRNMEAPQ